MTTRAKMSDYAECAERELAFLDPADFDEAILGIATRFGDLFVVAYDRSRVIDILARDMPREEAEEFFEFNTAGMWIGDTTPIFIDTRYAE